MLWIELVLFGMVILSVFLIVCIDVKVCVFV